MTRKEVQEELDIVPFIPFRLHLVSGKTQDVNHSDEGWMLKNAVLIMRRRRDVRRSYNVVSLFNIERIERLADA